MKLYDAVLDEPVPAVNDHGMIALILIAAVVIAAVVILLVLRKRRKAGKTDTKERSADK